MEWRPACKYRPEPRSDHIKPFRSAQVSQTGIFCPARLKMDGPIQYLKIERLRDICNPRLWFHLPVTICACQLLFVLKQSILFYYILFYFRFILHLLSSLRKVCIFVHLYNYDSGTYSTLSLKQHCNAELQNLCFFCLVCWCTSAMGASNNSVIVYNRM